jgi:hypothetical protein
MNRQHDIEQYWQDEHDCLCRLNSDTDQRIAQIREENAAVTVTVSLVANREHAPRMALQKRFSKVRKQSRTVNGP